MRRSRCHTTACRGEPVLIPLAAVESEHAPRGEVLEVANDAAGFA